MKHQLKNLGIILMLSIILLNSCITASIVSNVDRNNSNINIGKIYVTMRGSEGADKFYLVLKDLLKTELNKRGVEMDCYIFQSLSLESDSAITKKVNLFNPDVLLTMNQTESRRVVNTINQSPGATFDIRIYKLSNTMIWRASLKTETFSALEEGANVSCKRIIEALEQDGFIKKINKN